MILNPLRIFADIWRHRYLLGQLIQRDVLLRYRGSMFGVLWIFLSPLLMLDIFASVFGHPGDRIKQALTFGRVRFRRECTALQDIFFDIKRGETVGIIGRNSSGESTLRQLILKPTSGPAEAWHEYGVELQPWDCLPQANAIVLALNTLRRLNSSAAASLADKFHAH